MKRKDQKNVVNSSGNDDGLFPESKKICMRRELEIGNVIWIRIRNGTWWPAQVVDEKRASGSNKSQINKLGEVFVRLYGSYEYLYVNPSKHDSRFENVLKQHNYSLKDIFLESLAKDLSQLKSVAKSKRKASELEEHAGCEVGVVKGLMGNTVKRKQQDMAINSTVGTKEQHLMDKANRYGGLMTPKRGVTHSELREEDTVLGNGPLSRTPCSRPTKMMQMLGLMAPCGSPFRKNGVKCTISVLL